MFCHPSATRLIDTNSCLLITFIYLLLGTVCCFLLFFFKFFFNTKTLLHCFKKTTFPYFLGKKTTTKNLSIPESAVEDLVESQSGELESQIRAESPLSPAMLDLVKLSLERNPGSRRYGISWEVFPESGRLVCVAATAGDKVLCTF